MKWFAAWWRQITGGPPSDPWQDDPHIRAERAEQHARINKANEGDYYAQMAERAARERLIDKQGNPWGLGGNRE